MFGRSLKAWLKVKVGRDNTGVIVAPGKARDIHITMNGAPSAGRRLVPRLRDNRPLPAKDDDLGLLSWETPLGPLVGRNREKGELITWARSGDPAPLVRVLSGPGGAGKSRLAHEVGVALRDECGFSAGFIEGYDDGALVSDGRPILAIVDYAEQHRDDVVSFLERLPDAVPEDIPVRILLLSRHPLEWWRRTSDDPATRKRFDFQDFEINHLSDRDAYECFANATAKLAEHLDKDAPLVEPEALVNWIARDRQLHALPLLIRAAAVQAVRTPDMALRESGMEVISALARREGNRIDGVGTELWPELGWAGRLAALCSLTDGLTVPMVEVLARTTPSLKLPGADKLADMLPQLPNWRKDRLEPVTPDLVAAMLLLDALEVEAWRHVAGLWLTAMLELDRPETAARLSRVAYDIRVMSRGKPNRLVALLLDVVRTDSVAARILATMGSLRPPDLVPVLVVASERIISSGEAETADRVRLLERYAALLLDSGELSRAIGVIDRAVTMAKSLNRSDPDFDVDILASVLTGRANFFGRVRQFDKALADAEAAVALRRELVAMGRSDAEAALANSLQTLALRASEAGKAALADQAIEDALTLYRGKLADDPKHARDEARSLHNYASRLQENGNRRAAVLALRDAVARRRELARESPALNEIDLTYSLLSLAYRLGEAGEYGEAIKLVEEVLEIRERLTSVNVRQVGTDLLYAYSSLSNLRFEFGHLQDAIMAAQQGVARGRSLVAQSPGVFEVGLVSCLLALAWRQIENGDPEAALSAAKDAVDLIEPFALREPARFEPELSDSLHAQARCLRDVGELDTALAVNTRATEIRRQLMNANLFRYGLPFAISRRMAAWYLSNRGDLYGGVAAGEDALTVARKLVAAAPARFEPELAITLVELGWRCQNAGRYEDSVEAADEAIELLQKHLESAQQRFLPWLSIALRLRSEASANLGRYDAALGDIAKAQAALRSVQSYQTRWERDHLNCLRSLSSRLAEAGEYGEAIKLAGEVLDIRERPNAKRFGAELLYAYSSLSNFKFEFGQLQDAIATAQRGVARGRSLVAQSPGVFEAGLVSCLLALAWRQIENGDPEAALAAAKDAVDLIEPFALREPARFEPELSDSLHAQARCLRDVGELDAALAVNTRATEIRRKLMNANLFRYGFPFAISRRMAAWYLSNRGDLCGGVAAGKDALTVARKLVAAAAARFEPELAMTLVDLGWRCQDAGRYEDSVEAADEAIELLQKHLQSAQQRFLPWLSTALRLRSEASANLGRHDAALGDIAKAQAALRNVQTYQTRWERDRLNCEYSAIWRMLDAGRDPGAAISDAVDACRSQTVSPAYSLNLLTGLARACDAHRTLGDRPLAHAEAAEALKLARALKRDRGKRFGPELCDALRLHAAILAQIGLTRPALTAIQEAVDLRAGLFRAEPGRFRLNLAHDYWSLSHRKRAARDFAGALRAIQEAVALFEDLRAGCPARFSEDLSRALWDLCFRRLDARDHDGARAAGARALRIVGPRRPLFCLRNASHLRAATRKPAKALRWAERAQARAEAAAREHGPAASVEWAWTLVERADRRRAQREIASAVKDLNIALSILAGLAKAEQPRFGPDAAQVSSRLADLHATADADKESQAARQNAWSLYRALSVKEPVTFAVSLAETLLSVGRAAPDDLTTLSLFRAAGRMLRRCERDSYGADQLLPVVLYEIAVVLWRLRAWSAAIRMLVQSARLDEERLADEPESRARRAAKTLLDLAHASREAGKYRIANAAISKARELCDRFPALMNADLIREIDRYNLPEMSRLHRLWTAASKAAISLHQITLIEITSLARDLRSVRPRAR